jgi:hypothetical protein
MQLELFAIRQKEKPKLEKVNWKDISFMWIYLFIEISKMINSLVAFFS